MSAALHLAHLRPTEVRALVVEAGVPRLATVGTDAGSLRAIVGGAYSFLVVMGGTEGRGVVLICRAAALNALAAKGMPHTTGEIARALGVVVAVGPARLRGRTVWTSLTPSEVEFWQVALGLPARKRRPAKPTKGETP